MAQETNKVPLQEEDVSTKVNTSPVRRWLVRGLTVILILLLIALLGWGAYYIFIGPSNNDGNTTESNQYDPSLISPPIFMAPLDYQVALRDGRRFLAVSVRLEVIDDATAAFIANRIPIVNDVIISTLQRKSSNDLRDAAGVAQLKVDISRRLNNGKLFSSEFISSVGSTSPIVGVYFDKFILQ